MYIWVDHMHINAKNIDGCMLGLGVETVAKHQPILVTARHVLTIICCDVRNVHGSLKLHVCWLGASAVSLGLAGAQPPTYTDNCIIQSTRGLSFKISLQALSEICHKKAISKVRIPYFCVLCLQ